MKKSLLILLILSVSLAYINYLVLESYQHTNDLANNNTVELLTDIDTTPVVTGVNYTRIYRDDISERVSFAGYVYIEEVIYITSKDTVINYNVGDIVYQGSNLYTDYDTGEQKYSNMYGRVSGISVEGDIKTLIIEDLDTVIIKLSIPTSESSIITEESNVFYLDGFTENELTIDSIELDETRDLLNLELSGVNIEDYDILGSYIEIFLEKIYEYDVKIIPIKSLGEQISENIYLVTIVTQTSDGLEFERVEVEVGKIINQQAILITNLPVDTKVVIVN